MLIFIIKGGLGNQMFQYAFSRSMEIRGSVQPYYDLRCYDQKLKGKKYITFRELDIKLFNIKYLKESSFYHRYLFKVFDRIGIAGFKIYNETNQKKIYADVDLHIKSGYFNGYWQFEDLFVDIREVLLKEFTLMNPFGVKNKNLENNIENSNSVSVHVRRGDYVEIGCFLENAIEYYSISLNRFSLDTENPHFFIFSDDMDWAKKNINSKSPITYIDWNIDSPHLDLILMSKCKHNIIANSTFSWWGAWLNQNPHKIVIAPRSIEQNNTKIPSTWELI